MMITPVAQGPAQVIIVGAGPSGLMMAAQLLRYGVQPVIIDSRQGPTHHSKALAVQARSLELYRQMGIIESVIQGGKPAGGLKFINNGELKAEMSLQAVGEGVTPFPYVLMYEQSKNERTLLAYLTQKSCPVYWNTSLVSLQQGTGVVSVTLQTPEQQYTLVANWLTGADGAHSMVRRQLQIPFNGDTYPSRFYLADVVLDHDVDTNWVNLHLDAKSFIVIFPLPDAGAYRIVGSLNQKLAAKPDLQLNDVLADVQQKVQQPFTIKECKWFTTYNLHHRMAEKFSQGRCFLIGDAAHIHSPVGGQGMNTGLQDAANLAWKLAGVIQNRLKFEVLNTYAAERMPVARNLLQTTDRAFKFILSQNTAAQWLKKWLLPVMLKKLWQQEKWRHRFFERVAQLNINHQHSTLTLHLSQLTSIRAGDRLPYLKIYDERKQQQTDLHAWCSKPGFTLITMGPLQELYVFSLAKWITQNYNGWLNFFHLPPSVKNQQVFDAFDIKPHHSKAMIVRPDMYIGLLNDVVDLEMMKNYLENVAMAIPQPSAGADGFNQ
jgi:2-polyprenyl-6-methoxyphenol hydroxylase-like FAD-dependent oxidoreductase